MKALGLIETKGLLAAIECADAMLKSADVSLLEKTKVGGGFTTITVSGDVGAVKAAIEAGAAAVKQLDQSLLVSEHVIPRPHEDLADVVVSVTPLIDKIEENKAQPKATVVNIKSEEIEPTKQVVAEEKTPQQKASQPTSSIHKEDIDKMVSLKGIDEGISFLKGQKVTKLRSLARKYKDFGITGRRVSKADKNLLLKEFKAYYEK